MLLWVLLLVPTCRHGPGITPTGWQVQHPRQRAPHVPLPIWPVVGATSSCPAPLGIKLTPGDSDPLFLIHPGIWRGKEAGYWTCQKPTGQLGTPDAVAPSGRMRPAGSEDGPGLLSSQMSTPHRGGLSLFCEQAAPWTHPGA